MTNRRNSGFIDALRASAGQTCKLPSVGATTKKGSEKAVGGRAAGPERKVEGPPLCSVLKPNAKTPS